MQTRNVVTLAHMVKNCWLVSFVVHLSWTNCDFLFVCIWIINITLYNVMRRKLSSGITIIWAAPGDCVSFRRGTSALRLPCSCMGSIIITRAFTVYWHWHTKIILKLRVFLRLWFVWTCDLFGSKLGSHMEWPYLLIMPCHISHVAGKPVCGSMTRESSNQPAELQRLASFF